MLSQFLDKLFGVTNEVVPVASVADPVQDPGSRYLEISAEIYSSFGRNRVQGDFVGNAATTPETASMQYCRI